MNLANGPRRYLLFIPTKCSYLYFPTAGTTSYPLKGTYAQNRNMCTVTSSLVAMTQRRYKPWRWRQFCTFTHFYSKAIHQYGFCAVVTDSPLWFTCPEHTIPCGNDGQLAFVHVMNTPFNNYLSTMNGAPSVVFFWAMTPGILLHLQTTRRQTPKGRTVSTHRSSGHQQDAQACFLTSQRSFLPYNPPSAQLLVSYNVRIYDLFTYATYTATALTHLKRSLQSYTERLMWRSRPPARPSVCDLVQVVPISSRGTTLKTSVLQKTQTTDL